MDVTPQIIENNTFDASGLDIRTDGIYEKEKRYLLTPLKHRILTESKVKSREWSTNIFMMSLGIILIIISKIIVFVYKFSNANEKELHLISTEIQKWELVYVGLGLLISGALLAYSTSKYDKDEKRDLLNEIKNYFNGE